MDVVAITLPVAGLLLCAMLLIRPALLRGAIELAHTRMVAVVVWFCVGVLMVFGSALLGPPNRWFDLDGERNLATAFAVGLVVAAATAAAGLARERRGLPLHAVAAAWIFSGVLVLMALDDWFIWHEKLEGVGGMPWTLWYLPVPGIAVLTGASLGRCLTLRSQTYLALGFLAWFAAAVIETFFWGSGPDFQSPVTMPIEEVLEMAAPIALFVGLSRALIAPGGVTAIRRSTSR